MAFKFKKENIPNYITFFRLLLVPVYICVFFADYPRTMVEITYKMSFRFIVESDLLSEEEKELFLCKNAKEFYGFDGLTECKTIDNML